MSRFQRRIATAVGVLFAATVGWFLLVDLSWFEEQCPDCRYSRTDIRWRFITLPVHTWEEPRPTALQVAAHDLGVPCQHRNLHRWHKQRWWGLLYCKCPCHHGIVDLSRDHSWYDATAAEKLRQLAKDDPELANNFQRRVLVEHDFAYWRGIVRQIAEPEPIRAD